MKLFVVHIPSKKEESKSTILDSFDSRITADKYAKGLRRRNVQVTVKGIFKKKFWRSYVEVYPREF